MDVDLTTASRTTLLALIAAQQATIAQQAAVVVKLQKRITELETRLTARGSPGMPGNKPSAPKRIPRNQSRKKRERGCARLRMTPTEQVTHAMDTCPACGTHLVGGWIQRTREVLEIRVVPVRVIEHVYLVRECPLCAKRHVPRAELAGVVVDQQRLGVNLVSLITTLREEGRLPFQTIQWYLQTFHALHLSVGTLVAAIHRTARHAGEAVGQIREQIRGSPHVNADETGWREDGNNGYVWTFSTPMARYFVRRRRTKEVVDEVLGPDFSGVLGSDFYAVIDNPVWSTLMIGNGPPCRAA